MDLHSAWIRMLSPACGWGQTGEGEQPRAALMVRQQESDWQLENGPVKVPFVLIFGEKNGQTM